LAYRGRDPWHLAAPKEGSKFSIDIGTKSELCSSFVQEDIMFRAVVEEAAALTSIALFLGMIAVWAQVLGAL
jgi:hypothetical protein